MTEHTEYDVHRQALAKSIDLVVHHAITQHIVTPRYYVTRTTLIHCLLLASQSHIYLDTIALRQHEHHALSMYSLRVLLLTPLFKPTSRG